MDSGIERPQKRMRKGTKSCAECESPELARSCDGVSVGSDNQTKGRRRKIRCNYLPGLEDCAQCSVRGSKCTSQGLVVPDDYHEEEQASPVIVSIGPAVGGSTPRRTTEIDDLDISTGPRPPLVSMLNRGKVFSDSGAASAPSHAHASIFSDQDTHRRHLSNQTQHKSQAFARLFERTFLAMTPSSLLWPRTARGGRASARRRGSSHKRDLSSRCPPLLPRPTRALVPQSWEYLWSPMGDVWSLRLKHIGCFVLWTTVLFRTWLLRRP
jgi:hypothetical protein